MGSLFEVKYFYFKLLVFPSILWKLYYDFHKTILTIRSQLHYCCSNGILTTWFPMWHKNKSIANDFAFPFKCRLYIEKNLISFTHRIYFGQLSKSVPCFYTFLKLFFWFSYITKSCIFRKVVQNSCLDFSVAYLFPGHFPLSPNWLPLFPVTSLQPHFDYSFEMELGKTLFIRFFTQLYFASSSFCSIFTKSSCISASALMNYSTFPYRNSALLE